MKNRLVVTISIYLIFISTSVFAQVSPYIIGVESGLGFSSIRPSLNDNSIRVSFTEALTGQYNFSDLLAVKTGLGYELKGSKGLLPLEANPVGEGKYYQNFHFLTLPILAKVMLSKKLKYFKNDIKYFANAGPYFGYLVRQNYKITATEYSAEIEVNNTDNYKRFEVGFTLGAGLSYSIYKNITIMVELRDNLGLNNLNNSGQSNENKIKTNTAYFLVGMAFNL